MIVIFMKRNSTSIALNSISSFNYMKDIFNNFNKSYILITFMIFNKFMSNLYLKIQNAYTRSYAN